MVKMRGKIEIKMFFREDKNPGMFRASMDEIGWQINN
jgi:hypothetical protein